MPASPMFVIGEVVSQYDGDDDDGDDDDDVILFAR